MKFNVSSATLCNRLQALGRVVPSKSTVSILECVLFELHDSQLTMTGSDSETTLITTLEVQDCQGEGRFAIKAATIINGLKEIADQPITIEVNDENHEIFITYQNGKSSFVGLSGAEYPQTQSISNETQEISIPADALLTGLSRTIFATAEDELRPIMNGVLFDITPEGVIFVASDGHKLVRNLTRTSRSEQPTAFTLPKKPARTLKDVLGKESGDAIIKFDDKNAQIQLENFTLGCRLVDGRYPNYASVIPQDNPYHVTIDRQALLGALRRVLVFASTSTSLVKLRIEPGNVTVSTQDIDFSTSAEEHIICDYNGNTMSIGFKGTFLLDILNSISANEIVLQLADPSKAGVIVPVEQNEDEDLLMLLMPMMLND